MVMMMRRRRRGSGQRGGSRLEDGDTSRQTLTSSSPLNWLSEVGDDLGLGIIDSDGKEEDEEEKREGKEE